MKKRLFIAAPVKVEKNISLIHNWQRHQTLNQNKINWVVPDNWHITLHFLGDTETSQIPVIQTLMQKYYGETESFSSPIQELGAFPNIRKPKVIWTKTNLDPLMEARANMQKQLLDSKILVDTKPFKPHLTIARVKYIANKESMSDFLHTHKNLDFGDAVINKIILFESKLKPSGPVYLPVFTLELK